MSADSDTPAGRCPSCGGPVVPALASRGVARYACVPCSAKPDGPALYIAAELDTSPNTPEPAPVASDRPAVWDLVIADMRERDRLGEEKYGTRLQSHNGRAPMVDAYQEALDLAVYLRQAIEEGPPESGRISAYTRGQIAAAEQACADGRGGCVGQGCVPGHVAADVLAAYDAVGPAVVEVMRDMMARKRTLMLAYEVTANPMHARFLDGGASRLTWALEELRKALDLPCDWDQS